MVGIYKIKYPRNTRFILASQIDIKNRAWNIYLEGTRTRGEREESL